MVSKRTQSTSFSGLFPREKKALERSESSQVKPVGGGGGRGIRVPLIPAKFSFRCPLFPKISEIETELSFCSHEPGFIVPNNFCDHVLSIPETPGEVSVYHFEN